jgi:peptidoglycan/LPS O-acetylase OafA/YrhL
LNFQRCRAAFLDRVGFRGLPRKACEHRERWSGLRGASAIPSRIILHFPSWLSVNRVNNFDLIRLVAASEVMYTHCFNHSSLEHGAVLTRLLGQLENLLHYFFGVPIFFTISGFLIYASFDRNQDLRIYIKNRFLRIYPALWVCFAITVGILIYFRFITLDNFLSLPIVAWVVTQVTFLQLYTPDVFRAFGTDTPNGSLWTISVEIEYYTVLPILYWSIRKRSRTVQNLLLLGLALLSWLFNRWVGAQDQNLIIIKFFNYSIPAFFFHFVFGIMIYINFQQIRRWLEGKMLWWLLLYGAYAGILSGWLGLYQPSYFPTAYALGGIIIASGLTIATAFSFVSLSQKLLRGYDLSYGTYLYHMVALNVFVELGLNETYPEWTIVGVMALSYLAAWLSWVLIERKAMALKHHNFTLWAQQVVLGRSSG